MPVAKSPRETTERRKTVLAHSFRPWLANSRTIGRTQCQQETVPEQEKRVGRREKGGREEGGREIDRDRQINTQTGRSQGKIKL